MKVSSIAVSALAGVAGAVALMLLHRALRGVPRSGVRSSGSDPLGDARRAGDLISKGVYFGLTGAFGRDRALATGALLGVAAGVGSVILPQRTGPRAAASHAAADAQAIEVGLYAAGGLVAGATYRLLRS